MNWQKLDSQDGYYIYKALQKNSRDYKLIKETTGTKYVDKDNLQAGVTYYYAIQSYRILNGEKVETAEWGGFYPKTIAKINPNGIYASSAEDYVVGESIEIGEYLIEIDPSYVDVEGEEPPMIYIEFKSGDMEEYYFKENGPFIINSDMKKIGLSQLTLKLK